MRRSAPRWPSQPSISAATFGATKSGKYFRPPPERGRPTAQRVRPEVAGPMAGSGRRVGVRDDLICERRIIAPHYRSRSLSFLSSPESAESWDMTKRVVDVLVPVALDRAYSYRVPEELELAPGDIVCVLLGAREATAVVWADNPKPNPRLDTRLKDVEQNLELPPLRPELRSFVDWVANYTVSSRGMVLRMCLRMGEHLGAERERVGVRLAGAPPQRMTPARQRALALFADGMVRGKSDAAREAGVSVGVIDGLIDEGTLEVLVLPPEPVAQKPDADFVQSEFTADRSAAAAALKATVAKGGYSVTLLDGVTGSGKTEVYFEAVADTIRRGRQSLILMPEIALTAQFLDRFAARFGVRPAEWHSELSPRKRARTWRAVADGEVSVVVGARSALFLPYADLGLI